MIYRVLILALSASLMSCGEPPKETLSSLVKSTETEFPYLINIKITGYRPQEGNVHQALFVSNFSVKASQGQLLYSTDRDGLSDSLKELLTPQYGFSSLISPESVVNGISDHLLFRMGIDSSSSSLIYCADQLMQNSANDAIIYDDTLRQGSANTVLGLRDCEKMYLGLNSTNFDHNQNSIPDYLELRCGLNPLNSQEAYLSAAGDGISNLEKCKRNIPIDESAFSSANQLFSYHYTTDLNVADGTTDFAINNIPVLNKGKDNFIVFYIIETNSTSKMKSLYTAFLPIKSEQTYNSTIKIPFWISNASQFYNQELSIQ